ncbi:MAG: hypothetical protein Q8K91_09795 [Hylemonella sp.]|nr:hypothetical protein [Hylemonella sp.]MDP1937482.1 hypothetical protein [Hylemonella sp.]
MEFFLPLLLLVIALQFLKIRDQRQRIALLGAYLSRFQIEKLMENLTEGYLRALDENDPERRAQIWSMLGTAELELSEQFKRFSADFSTVWGDKTLVSTLPVAIPYASKLFPQASFDLRQVLAIHAQGIAAVAENRHSLSLRDKAYMLSAELFLMQHSCHWFCRSKAVASARMLARHKTSHAQLVESVSPPTREAYLRLIGG